MPTISISTIIITIVLIWIGSAKNPFVVAYLFLRELIVSRKFLLVFSIMIGVLLINKYELQWEQEYSTITSDFTSLFFSIEGFFVRNFQQFFHSPWISEVTVFFYVIVFQSILVASIGVYIGEGNKVFVLATCYTVIINYLVAIPFYVLMPVSEVWSYAPAQVTFYMKEVFTNFDQVYRPLSGLDNCFPSLHTAISVSMAMLAFKSGNRRWAIVTGISAFIVVFAIFYLGIHWLIDMISGVTLAYLASTVGLKLAQRTNRTNHVFQLSK